MKISIISSMNKEIKGEHSSDVFKVSFGGSSSIDAKHFSNTINSTLNLLQESAKVINPDAYLKLEIQANNEGSFESLLEAIVLFTQTVFTPENIGVASLVIDGMIQWLDIKQHLKGEPPKKVENNNNNKTIVTNVHNETKSFSIELFNNFIKNPKIQLFVINIFSNTKDREFVEYSHNTETRRYFREDYKNMLKPISDLNTETKKEQNIVEVDLLLKKPDLLGNSKWQFVYTKNIEAEIEDKDFLDKLHKGKINIIAGIKIPSRLLIEYDLDENYNIIENSERYIIKEVIGDIIYPKTEGEGKLF